MFRASTASVLESRIAIQQKNGFVSYNLQCWIYHTYHNKEPFRLTNWTTEYCPDIENISVHHHYILFINNHLKMVIQSYIKACLFIYDYPPNSHILLMYLFFLITVHLKSTFLILVNIFHLNHNTTNCLKWSAYCFNLAMLSWWHII